LSGPGRHDEPPDEGAVAWPLGARSLALGLGCVSEAVDASEGSASMALMAAAAARMDDHDEYAKLVRRMNPPR